MVTLQALNQLWYRNIVMKFSKIRSQKISLNGPEESVPVPIAGDAGIATGDTRSGRLIPLLILDTTNRPDLTEAIRIQSSVPSGDVEIFWGKLSKKSEHISLFLSFKRPTNRNALIEFDLVKRGILIESILTTKAVYIQAGKPGDRISDDLNRPKVLIEIPDTGFRPYWDKIYSTSLMKYFHKAGYSRKEAKLAVKAHLKNIREYVQFRIDKKH